MLRITVILTLFVNITVITAQYKPVANFTHTVENMFNAATDICEWYDIPISAAYYYRNIVNTGNIGDKITLNPAEYEKTFSGYFGHNDNYTVGSMDKDIIPDMIFYMRLGGNFLYSMADNSYNSREAFKRIFLFRKSLIYTYTLTEYVKNLVKRTRPDGSDDRSFFSGHTSTTFAACTFLYMEINESLDEWEVTRADKTLRRTLKVAGFTTLMGWASFVGYSRIRDKKHYLSDVLVGAAVGSFVSYYLFSHYIHAPESIKMFEIFPTDKSLYLSLRVNF